MIKQTADGKNDMSVTEKKLVFLRLFSATCGQLGQQAVHVHPTLYPEYFPIF
jgi:hypothetical protein